MVPFYVIIGGFFGAIFRFIVNSVSPKINNSKIPFHTLFVNITGAFLFGFILNINTSDYTYYLLAVGFLGAYTTFSTVMIEMAQMILEGKIKTFVIYFFFTFCIGISSAFLGVIAYSLL